MVTVLHDRSLAAFNTFGVEARARHFVEISSPEDLQWVLDQQPGDLLILGGGSNLLFVEGFDGWVLQNNIQGKEVVHAEENKVVVAVGGGENWHQFVLWCLEHDYGGVENLALIPGTVGAAPMQNIGAYGVELEDVFHHLEAVELETGKVVEFSKEDCQFGYRQSVFKHKCKGQYFITKVFLQLTKVRHPVNTSYGAIQSLLNQWNITKPTIQEVAKAVIHIRSSKLPDPAVLGNAGSFFKNPIIPTEQFQGLYKQFPDMPHYDQPGGKVKLAAGWLIEQCGWKGKRIGNTGAYEKQALVLVNYGGATGEEIWSLARQIQQSVYEKFEVLLEPEVNVVGG